MKLLQAITWFLVMVAVMAKEIPGDPKECYSPDSIDVETIVEEFSNSGPVSKKKSVYDSPNTSEQACK